jgi:hypothetical protein
MSCAQWCNLYKTHNLHDKSVSELFGSFVMLMVNNQYIWLITQQDAFSESILDTEVLCIVYSPSSQTIG